MQLIMKNISKISFWEFFYLISNSKNLATRVPLAQSVQVTGHRRTRPGFLGNNESGIEIERTVGTAFVTHTFERASQCLEVS